METELSGALTDLTLFRKFKESRQNLSPEDLAILSEARNRLREQLKDVGQFEPGLNIPRYEYRLDCTNRIVDELPDGPARATRRPLPSD